MFTVYDFETNLFMTMNQISSESPEFCRRYHENILVSFWTPQPSVDVHCLLEECGYFCVCRSPAVYIDVKCGALLLIGAEIVW